MWRLPRADPGSLYIEGAGEDLACEVFAVQRVPRPAERQVLRPERSAVLQGGLLQVSKFLKRLSHRGRRCLFTGLMKISRCPVANVRVEQTLWYEVFRL